VAPVDDMLADLQLVVAQARHYQVLAPAFRTLGLLCCHVDAAGQAHYGPQGVSPDVASWYFGPAVLERRGADICMWEHTGSIQEDGKPYVSYMVPVKTRYGSTRGWTLITLPVGSREALER